MGTSGFKRFNTFDSNDCRSNADFVVFWNEIEYPFGRGSVLSFVNELWVVVKGGE